MLLKKKKHFKCFLLPRYLVEKMLLFFFHLAIRESILFYFFPSQRPYILVQFIWHSCEYFFSNKKVFKVLLCLKEHKLPSQLGQLLADLYYGWIKSRAQKAKDSFVRFKCTCLQIFLQPQSFKIHLLDSNMMILYNSQKDSIIPFLIFLQCYRSRFMYDILVYEFLGFI